MRSIALFSFIGTAGGVVDNAKPRSLTQRAKIAQKGMLRMAEAAAVGGAVVGALSGAGDCSGEKNGGVKMTDVMNQIVNFQR